MSLLPIRAHWNIAIISSIFATPPLLVGLLCLNEYQGWFDVGWSSGFISSEPRRFLRQVKKIQPGMTETQVDQVMAKYGPSERYQRPEWDWERERLTKRPTFAKHYLDSRFAREGTYFVWVDFDERDCVIEVERQMLIK